MPITSYRRLLPALAPVALGAIIAAAPVAVLAQAEEQSVPPEQAAFEQRVRDYLMTHPEVIVEALHELDRRQKAESEAQQKQALIAHRDALVAAPGDPVAGNPAGAITVVEFFDYRCPYCKAIAADMIETLDAEGDVRIVFKEFPILGQDSIAAAHAALAADRQGKYLPFHQALMAHEGALDRAALLDVAEEVGLDTARLQEDMEAPEIVAIIQRNLDLADALRIGGTPAFVVGDTLVPGAVDMETLRRLVDDARSG